MKRRHSASRADAGLAVKDAAKLMPDPMRRRFLRGAASLGALALLTGCDIIDGDSTENALKVVSRFNDKAQAALFNPNKLAPTYSEKDITRPFPFNVYYRLDEAPAGATATWKLEI
jgi:DMSO/TMAO reductase YedYZ molybdopterin-dependent catalytic subunit